jgi:hypothetical protein
LRGAHDPAGRHPIRALTAEGNCEHHRFGALPLTGSRRATDIADRVPALDQDQQPPAIVPQTDIGRPPWLGWAGRELERPDERCSPTKTKDEFLDGEVARIGGFLKPVALQPDDEWPADGERQPLPRVEGVAATEPTLDRTLGRSRDPGDVRYLLLCRATTMPSRSHLAPEASQLFQVAPVRFGREFSSLDLGHDRCMVAPNTWLRLIPGFQAAPQPSTPSATLDHARIGAGSIPLSDRRSRSMGLCECLVLTAPMQRAPHRLGSLCRPTARGGRGIEEPGPIDRKSVV